MLLRSFTATPVPALSRGIWRGFLGMAYGSFAPARWPDPAAGPGSTRTPCSTAKAGPIGKSRPFESRRGQGSTDCSAESAICCCAAVETVCQPQQPGGCSPHDHLLAKPALPARWSPESVANGRSCQETPGSASEIAEVYPTSVGSGSQPRCQVQGLIDQGRIRSSVLTHITQNRPLGARCDDRIGDAIDPYFGPATIAAFFAQQGLQRVYPISTRKLAETQGNHAGVWRHNRSSQPAPQDVTAC
jgi:hypothetical protein